MEQSKKTFYPESDWDSFTADYKKHALDYQAHFAVALQNLVQFQQERPGCYPSKILNNYEAMAECL
ncbi:MAG: hypothetical protein ACFCUU_11995 [Cyclobacteriaceae bacterium]